MDPVGRLAIWMGRFFGAMLAECAPVLSRIIGDAIKKAMEDTAEDGAVRPDLRARLLERLRSKDGSRSGGGASAPSEDNQES